MYGRKNPALEVDDEEEDDDDDDVVSEILTATSAVKLLITSARLPCAFDVMFCVLLIVPV